MTDQFDSPWKEALEEYFEEGMAFFFPKIHADIDWSQGHEFLDKELEKVVRQASVTQQSVDKLVQVYQKSEADPTWVLVHLDVQSQHDRTYAEPSPRPSPTGQGSKTSLPLGGTEGGDFAFLRKSYMIRISPNGCTNITIVFLTVMTVRW